MKKEEMSVDEWNQMVYTNNLFKLSELQKSLQEAGLWDVKVVTENAYAEYVNIECEDKDSVQVKAIVDRVMLKY